MNRNDDDVLPQMDSLHDATDARTAPAVVPEPAHREPCWQCEGTRFDGFLCGFCGRRHHVAEDGTWWSSWEPWGVLRIDEDERRDPAPEDFADPRFDVIWTLIRRLDVDFDNGLRSGATCNDVAAILDRLDAVGTQPPSGLREDSGAPRTVDADNATQSEALSDRAVAASRLPEAQQALPKLDRATLEYIHNEWEFADRTEEEFDAWMHGLIKQAREQERLALTPPAPGAGEPLAAHLLRAHALRNAVCQMLSATGAGDVNEIALIAKEALTADNVALDALLVASRPSPSSGSAMPSTATTARQGDHTP